MHYRPTLVFFQLGSVLAQHPMEFCSIKCNFTAPNDLGVRAEDLYNVACVKIALDISNTHREQTRPTPSHRVNRAGVQAQHALCVCSIERPELPRP